MTNWIKLIFWDDLKEDVKFFIRNIKKIIKRVWYDSIYDMKDSWQ